MYTDNRREETMMILVNGGSSSGKSAFAESLILEQDKRERAEENKTCPSWYLATMIAWDPETPEYAGGEEFQDDRMSGGS